MKKNSKDFQFVLRSFASSLVIMSISLTGVTVYSEETDFDPASIAAGTIEGEILEVEKHTLVIKKQNGEEVRVRMPGQTEESAKNFGVGDQVEVHVTPEGITTSIQPLTGGLRR